MLQLQLSLRPFPPCMSNGRLPAASWIRSKQRAVRIISGPGRRVLPPFASGITGKKKVSAFFLFV